MPATTSTSTPAPFTLPFTLPVIRPCAQPAAMILAAGALGLFVLPGFWKVLSLAAIPLAMGKSLNCLE